MDIVFTKKAEKEYQKLPPREKSKIARVIASLIGDPFKGKKLEGKLRGNYAIKAWPYRVIYSIAKLKKVININSILHRQGAY